MILNENIFPYADERRSQAKFDIYGSDTTIIKSYPSAKISKASLTQECLVNQSGKPRTELRITLDDSEGYFDVSDKSSAYYSLQGANCIYSLSSVPVGFGAEYIPKNVSLITDISTDKKEVILKNDDALSILSDSQVGVGTVFNRYDSENKGMKLRNILQHWTKQCGLLCNVNISDEINDLMLFYRGFFLDNEVYYVGDGIYHAVRLLKERTGMIVRCFTDENGTLVVKKQDSTTTEIITAKNLIDYEVMSGEGGLIVRVRDRGNILRQLTDVVEIKDGEKSIKCEVYKQNYVFKDRVLSATWEGALL